MFWLFLQAYRTWFLTCPTFSERPSSIRTIIECVWEQIVKRI